MITEVTFGKTEERVVPAEKQPEPSGEKALRQGLRGVDPDGALAAAQQQLDRYLRPPPATASEVPYLALLSVLLPSLCVLITLMPFVNARPQLPGYLLLACVVLVVKEHRSPWWLVAVFGIWVNVHGTWLYGLGVLGLLVVAQVVDALHQFRTHSTAGPQGMHTLDGLWDLASRPLSEAQRTIIERAIGITGPPEIQGDIAADLGRGDPYVSIELSKGLERLDLGALADLSTGDRKSVV